MDSNSFQLCLATVPALDNILRDGARRALQSAIEREVDEYIQRNQHYLDKDDVKAVMARRDKIVEYFQKLIAEKGENEVLY